MTKTLTEQWKNGVLKSGTYYIKVKYGNNLIYTFDYYNDRNNKWDFSRDIREVLNIVPSYDEYNELVQKIHILNEQNTKQYNELCEEIKKNNILGKKLEIATKALKEYADSSNWYETDDFGISAVDQFACDDYGYNIAKEALKEIEELK